MNKKYEQTIYKYWYWNCDLKIPNKLTANIEHTQWTKVARVDILVLFLILEEMLSAFQYSCLENPLESGGTQSMGSQRVGHDWVIKHSTFVIEYDVSCWFVRYGLYYVEVYSLLCPLSGEFYHKWILNFVKSSFCVYSDDHIVFILQFFNVVYRTNWFVDIEYR